MNMKPNTEQMLNTIFQEKELSQTTRRSYIRSVKYFEKHIQKTIYELIQIHEKEEKNPNITWRDYTLKKELISFRKLMYNTYTEGTAREYYTKIISILNFYEINLGRINPINKTKTKKPTPIDPDDLPDREMLKLCIETKNPLLKSSTLLLAHTGLSPVDMLNLTIEEYLVSTKEYHNYNIHHDVYRSIEEMNQHEQIIATFKGYRQKTGVRYITFAGTEAIKATNNYLVSRDDNLIPESKLFKTSRRNFNKIFQDVNEKLNLGQMGDYARFSPKNLRDYQATQLELAGMSDGRIDIIQGRKPSSIIRKHYIKLKTSVLKEEYIKALPYLVVEDINRVKTELDVEKEKSTRLEKEVKQYQEIVESIDERIEMKIKAAMENQGPLSEDEFEELFS